jgi:hypothetical protein
MVLDGLDGNEDFWDMAPSDDEVPTRNSLLDHSGERDDLCPLAHPHVFEIVDGMKDEQDLGAHSGVQVLKAEKWAEKERSLHRPVKLPNGKYRYL